MELKAESKGEALHLQKFGTMYADGVLKPDIHRRLVEEIEEIAQSARIPVRCIYQTAKGICTQEELQWAARYNLYTAQGVDGLVYVNTENTLNRMMALAGVFLRNFISAKVITVQDVCNCIADRQRIEDKVVFIPNFFLMKGQGGDMPSWKVSQLLGWLYERKAEGKATCIYVESLSGLKMEYGKPFYDLAKESYLEIKE